MTISDFNTPVNQVSFSAIVDACIARSGEVSRVSDIVAYANAAIREAQTRVCSSFDLRELVLYADSDGVLSWPIAPEFRRVRTVWYEWQRLAPTFQRPSKLQRHMRHKYYAANGQLLFGGTMAGEPVDLAYYVWSSPLQYYPKPSLLAKLQGMNLVDAAAVARPAYYDTVSAAWMYLQPDATYATTLPAEAAMEAARALSGNWLVTSWFNLIVAGTMSAIMTGRGDTTRSAPFYSQWQNQLATLAATSSNESLGF